MKRIEKFNYNSVAKKQKINEDEDVWGDDLEFDEVDKCLTQLESQNNNMTISSYDNFKTKANACSTQAFLLPVVPSTSKNYRYETQKNLSQISSTSVTTVIGKNITPKEFQQKLLDNIKKLEEKNKKLTEQYKTKDGEISILRIQLKQAVKTADNEKKQKMQNIEQIQQEWSQKYNTVVKDKENAKNELDLKQLEIINLREKLRDMKFQNTNLNDSLSSVSKDTNSTQPYRNKRFPNSTITGRSLNVSNQTENNDVNFVPEVSQLCYPLQRIIPEIFFNKPTHEFCEIIKLHSFKDNETFSRPNSSQYENVIDFKPPELNKVILSTEYFYTELIMLMKCTKTELNSENIIPHIKKIIFVTRNILMNVLEKLRHVEENLSNEDLRYMNEQYLYGKLDKYEENEDYCIFSGRPWADEELLIELRRSIAILATLAVNNLYIAKYLTNISPKNNTAASNLISQIEIVNNEENCDILDSIFDAVQMIGKIRRSHQFSGFFSSVLYLLTNLLNDIELTSDCYLLLHSIFQQIVFSRPNTSVLKYMSALLRKISFHSGFLTMICKNSKETSFRQSKISFNFSQETCTFQVLIVLLETYKQNVTFVYDVFSFLNDSLRTNSIWFHSQETIRCQCLCRFCTTSIDLLYKLMLNFKQNVHILNEGELRKYTSLFNIGLNVLNILTYRYADAILDSFKTHSQNLIWIRNMVELDKYVDYDSNQSIIKETLLASICNNELNEDDNFKRNDEQLSESIKLTKL